MKIVNSISLFFLVFIFLGMNKLAAETLANFEQGQLVPTGKFYRWLSYSDVIANGSSTVNYDIKQTEEKSFLNMKGELTNGFIYPFAGVQMLLKKNGTPTDISQFKGIKFRARGDGNVYHVQLLLAMVKDNNQYGHEFIAQKKWKTYQVEFSELKQATWGAPVKWDVSLIRGIGFHIDGAPLKFDLNIDDVEFY